MIQNLCNTYPKPRSLNDISGGIEGRWIGKEAENAAVRYINKITNVSNYNIVANHNVYQKKNKQQYAEFDIILFPCKYCYPPHEKNNFIKWLKKNNKIILIDVKYGINNHNRILSNRINKQYQRYLNLLTNTNAYMCYLFMMHNTVYSSLENLIWENDLFTGNNKSRIPCYSLNSVLSILN